MIKSVKKRLNKSLTSDLVLRLAFVASVLVLGAIIVSFRFNTPSGDDLVFSKQMESFGILEKIIHTYKSWSGRVAYFIIAGFVYKFVPLKILVYLSPLFSVGLLGISLFIVFYSLMSLLKLGVTKKRKFAAAFLSIITTLSIMLFSLATYDNFYWFAGVITYVIPLICFNILVFLFLKIVNKKREIGWSWHIGIALFGLFTATLNEAFSVQLFLAVALAIVLCLVFNKKTVVRPLLVLLAAVIVGLIIMKISPGNTVRMNLNQSLNPSLDSSLLGLIKMTVLTTIANLTKILKYNASGLATVFVSVLIASCGVSGRSSKASRLSLPSGWRLWVLFGSVVVSPIVMLAAKAFAIHYGGSPDITEYTLLTTNFFLYVSVVILAIMLAHLIPSSKLCRPIAIAIMGLVLVAGLVGMKIRAIDIVGRMVLQKAEFLSTQQQIEDQKAAGYRDVVIDESVEYFTYCAPAVSAEVWCNQANSYYYDVDSITASSQRTYRQHQSPSFYDIVMGSNH